MILRGIIMAEERLSQKTGIKEQVIQEIIQLAKENQVEKVILFGERARGDFKERSDIDLDKPVQKELLEAIRREGVLLYEKI